MGNVPENGPMTAPPPTMQTQPGQVWDSGPPPAQRFQSLDLPHRHPLAAEHMRARPVIRGRSPVQTVCINCNMNVIKNGSKHWAVSIFGSCRSLSLWLLVLLFH